MNFQTYDAAGKIVHSYRAKNKAECRAWLLKHPAWRSVSTIVYGRKTYTPSQVYSSF